MLALPIWTPMSVKRWAGQAMDHQSDLEDGGGAVGGFFSVSLDQVRSMVEYGASEAELISYLVLCRGKGGKPYSTWGANSCSTYTELTYHKAALALDWLNSNGYIKSLHDDGTTKNRPKWQVNSDKGEQTVFLSNALIDGVGQGKREPPMKRIYGLKMGRYGGIGAARLDALLVMLYMYNYHMIADYGGVSPASGLYRCWEPAGSDVVVPVTPIDGTDLVLHEISGGCAHVYTKFAAEALAHVDNENERNERFWDAINNLKQLGWLYETIQIWSADPALDRRAEPLYTLYVLDKHARKHDPCLARDINALALKAEVLDGYSEFFGPSAGEANIVSTGRFRYVAQARANSYPIGIYRLKFRPHTRDAAKGFYSELRRVEEWRQYLKTVAKQL